MNRGHFYTRFLVPTTCGGGGVKGANREQREQTGSKGSKQGAKGMKGSKGSKSISLQGFRVPTTCGRKNFDDHI